MCFHMYPCVTFAGRLGDPTFTGLPIPFALVVVDALDAQFPAVGDQPRQNGGVELWTVGVTEVGGRAESVGRPCGAPADRPVIVDAQVGQSPGAAGVGDELHKVW